MKTLIIGIMLMSLAYASSAQTKTTIKGIVSDSITRSPLEYATVAVVDAKDTTLISYTITEKNGAFHLSGLPLHRNAKLIVTYVGYTTFRRILDLKGDQILNLGNILLSGKHLTEVVITGERSPVTIRKDTIEFNAEAFKTRPNATVEELLRLLPGVQINMDGGIVMNGTGTSKVLVNGKSFFGANSTVATKNLDANMIDKIQVYDDRDNDPLHKTNQIDVKKIINLKLKSIVKKSTLGKINAAFGTRDRFDVSGIFSTFKDTLQVSLITTAGNTGTKGYGSGDLSEIGGFQRSESGRVNAENFNGEAVNGFVKDFKNAININNDYGNKLKINLAFYNLKSTAKTFEKSLNQQTIDSTILTSTANSGSKNQTNSNIIEGLIVFKPDTTNSFRYQPLFEYVPKRNHDFADATRNNTQHPMLSKSSSNSYDKLQSKGFSHWFNFFHNFKKKGEMMYIGHSLNLNRGISDRFDLDNLTSFIPDQPSRLFERYSDHDNSKIEVFVEGSYVYPLSKNLTIDVFSNSRYYKTKSRTLLYDKDQSTGLYQIYVSEQSSDLSRQTYIQNLKPQLIYKLKGKVEVKFGLDGEFQRLVNQFGTNVSSRKQNFLVLLPSLKISARNFYLDYYVWFIQPDIADIQPIVRDVNSLYKTIGNPSLQPTRSHNFYANYSKYILGKKTSLNSSVYLKVTNNSIVPQNVLDGNGGMVVTKINRGSSSFLSFSGGASKQLGDQQKLNVNLSTNLTPSLSTVPFLMNGDKGIQRNYALGIFSAASINYKTSFTLNLNYFLAGTLTEYGGVDYRSIKTYTHTIYDALIIRITNHITTQINHAFTYNPNVPTGFQKTQHNLNLNLALSVFAKDRGQIKISAFDLLNQNISVNRYAASNSIFTNEQEILKRYFLIGFQYKLYLMKK